MLAFFNFILAETNVKTKQFKSDLLISKVLYQIRSPQTSFQLKPNSITFNSSNCLLQLQIGFKLKKIKTFCRFSSFGDFHFLRFSFKLHISNFPSSISQDSNPRPLDRDSSALTTRPKHLAFSFILNYL